MRHVAIVWAPDDRGRHGRQPNEDDIGKPSNLGGATELDPLEPVREGHLSLPDLDVSGHSFMGDAADLMDVDWVETDPEIDEPVREEE